MTARRVARPGLSLLEVLIALAIFLIAYAAVWQLMSTANDQAVELTNRNRATQLAQAKLDEVVSGALPLESQGETGFEDEYNAPVIKVLDDVKPLPEFTTPKFTDCVENQFKAAMENVFLKGTAVQAALDDAAKQADACLAK